MIGSAEDRCKVKGTGEKRPPFAKTTKGRLLKGAPLANMSTGQCVSVAFSRTAVMGAWSEAINALPVL
jgi:hypothetical protein